MNRNYTRLPLASIDEADCFCIVPERHEGLTADADKVFLRQLAIIPIQTHSLNVGIADSMQGDLPDTDAIITFERNTPIGVVTADCVPILVYASDIGAAAAVHAGWKGTLGGIVDRTLDCLERHGADVSMLRVVFGPSISKGVYEVDRQLGEQFEDAGFEEYVDWPGGAAGKPHIDLQGVNMERLVRRGVRRENIMASDICTFKTLDLNSYRRDGDKSGRQLTAIVMR